jgi:hypothetical protein
MRSEKHLINSYRQAIDPPTPVTSSGKHREYVHLGSTAGSLPPTFPPKAARIGLSTCDSMRSHFAHLFPLAMIKALRKGKNKPACL